MVSASLAEIVSDTTGVATTGLPLELLEASTTVPIWFALTLTINGVSFAAVILMVKVLLSEALLLSVVATVKDSDELLVRALIAILLGTNS